MENNFNELSEMFKKRNEELEKEELRKVVDEYCKYNAYKFEYKDPQACSEGRINSLFN